MLTRFPSTLTASWMMTVPVFVRHHGAGHDANALAALHFARELPARVDGADLGERHRFARVEHRRCERRTRPSPNCPAKGH